LKCGIAVLVFSVYHIITDFKNIVTTNNLKSFLLSLKMLIYWFNPIYQNLTGLTWTRLKN